MSYKFIYAVIGSIILPVIIAINLISAKAQPYSANIVSSIGIGFVGGFIIGLARDRGETLKKRLKSMVNDRTKELALKTRELETSKKHVTVLRNLVTVCPDCRNIKNSDGNWQQPETYLHHVTPGEPDAGLCPDCSTHHNTIPEYQ